MDYKHFYSLFEQCLEQVDHVPQEKRAHLIGIAESFLQLAASCVGNASKPNAPTTWHSQ